MSLSVPERIAQVAEHFAKHSSHGYSQPNRGSGSAESVCLSDDTRVAVTNGDLDCSEMVRQCVDAAINGGHTLPIAYMWTGDEDEKLRSVGFKRIAYDPAKVRRGDVLWVKGHTGIALGGGKQADAHGDENGGITGPSRGDQTGHEIEVRGLRSWTYIYRYDDSPAVVPAGFTVTAGTERNVRSVPSTSSSSTITGILKPGESVICRGLTYANGLAWGVYDNYSGKVRYIALQGDIVVS